MSNMMDSAVFNLGFLLAILAVPVLLLVVWFFVNRISVRANEQIALLEALLEQQKQQTALLIGLCAANQQGISVESAVEKQFDDDLPIQLVAER